MSASFRFAIVDASGGAKTTNGESLTPAGLALMAQVLNVYANRDVASEYGGAGHLVRVAAGPNDVQPGEVPITVDATLSVAGAIAYHTTDGSADPIVDDGLTLSDSILGPGNSVLCALSHEVAETIGDEGCNLVAIDDDGTAKAREVCDPVETQTYAITTSGYPPAYVSNFVLRSYFVPGHAGPYDFSSSRGLQDASAGPPAPMQPASDAGGNYQVVYAGVGDPSQVTALGRPTARRGHLSSRARARGLR